MIRLTNEVRAQQKAITEELRSGKLDVSKNLSDYTKFHNQSFTQAQEIIVRELVTAEFHVRDWRNKLPIRDTLHEMWGWTHGVTGVSINFLWKSGRQDRFIVPDTSVDDGRIYVLASRFRTTINNLVEGK